MSAVITRDLPAEVYHRSTALGSSGLRELLRSPAHYWAAYLDPERAPRAETAAMRLGTMAHLAVLEPELFAGVVVAPKVDRRTKEGKAAWAAWEIESAGKAVATGDELAQASAIAAAVQSHPAAAALLSGAEREVSAEWIDPAHGVRCRARFDALSRERGIIVDLKTTEDARESEFSRSIAKWGYHTQAAHYLEAYRAAYGEHARAYVWIVAEKAAPYGVRVYTASPDLIARGNADRDRAIETLAECLREDKWPGYPVEISEIDLPGWA